jgi:hypothetical protein
MTDDEVLDSTEMKDKFIDLLKSRENYRMVSLTSVDIVTFSLLQAATSQTSIKGFIHGRNIRENAIVGYFPVEVAVSASTRPLQWSAEISVGGTPVRPLGICRGMDFHQRHSARTRAPLARASDQRAR